MELWDRLDSTRRGAFIEKLTDKLEDVLLDQLDDYEDLGPEEWDEPLDDTWEEGADLWTEALLIEVGISKDRADFDAIVAHAKTLFFEIGRRTVRAHLRAREGQDD